MAISQIPSLFLGLATGLAPATPARHHIMTPDGKGWPPFQGVSTSEEVYQLGDSIYYDETLNAKSMNPTLSGKMTTDMIGMLLFAITGACSTDDTNDPAFLHSFKTRSSMKYVIAEDWFTEAAANSFRYLMMKATSLTMDFPNRKLANYSIGVQGSKDGYNVTNPTIVQPSSTALLRADTSMICKFTVGADEIDLSAAAPNSQISVTRSVTPGEPAYADGANAPGASDNQDLRIGATVDFYHGYANSNLPGLKVLSYLLGGAGTTIPNTSDKGVTGTLEIKVFGGIITGVIKNYVHLKSTARISQSSYDTQSTKAQLKFTLSGLPTDNFDVNNGTSAYAVPSS